MGGAVGTGCVRRDRWGCCRCKDSMSPRKFIRFDSSTSKRAQNITQPIDSRHLQPLTPQLSSHKLSANTATFPRPLPVWLTARVTSPKKSLTRSDDIPTSRGRGRRIPHEIEALRKLSVRAVPVALVAHRPAHLLVVAGSPRRPNPVVSWSHSVPEHLKRDHAILPRTRHLCPHPVVADRAAPPDAPGTSTAATAHGRSGAATAGGRVRASSPWNSGRRSGSDRPGGVGHPERGTNGGGTGRWWRSPRPTPSCPRPVRHGADGRLTAYLPVRDEIGLLEQDIIGVGKHRADHRWRPESLRGQERHRPQYLLRRLG